MINVEVPGKDGGKQNNVAPLRLMHLGKEGLSPEKGDLLIMGFKIGFKVLPSRSTSRANLSILKGRTGMELTCSPHPDGEIEWTGSHRGSTEVKRS